MGGGFGQQPATTGGGIQFGMASSAGGLGAPANDPLAGGGMTSAFGMGGMGGLGSMGGGFGGAPAAPAGAGGADGGYDFDIDLSNIKAVEPPKSDPKKFKGKNPNSAFRDPDKVKEKRNVTIGGAETYHYEKQSSVQDSESYVKDTEEDEDDSDEEDSDSLEEKAL